MAIYTIVYEVEADNEYDALKQVYENYTEPTEITTEDEDED